ncbi:hypothetical protein [Petroclostridium sp. X23]|uniref:hypothetical protein n=1 Tax=Petroclostridium sp. X23 TaxID=3045146 RepID=UPI0024ACD899|nr:hypothetical protein [Petroclostridium sp. X23]WHH60274.1 hypothetical protein QKW49_05945 [Petroclostridium sp. X23]
MYTMNNLINIVNNDKRNNYDLHDSIKHIACHLKEYSKESPNSTLTIEELAQLFGILEEKSDRRAGPFYS